MLDHVVSNEWPHPQFRNRCRNLVLTRSDGSQGAEEPRDVDGENNTLDKPQGHWGTAGKHRSKTAEKCHRGDHCESRDKPERKSNVLRNMLVRPGQKQSR